MPVPAMTVIVRAQSGAPCIDARRPSASKEPMASLSGLDAGSRSPRNLTYPPRGRNRDLPSRTVPVDTTCQHRPESQGEDFRANAAPATHDVMPEFMDGDDYRQCHDKRGNREGEVSEAWYECCNFQDAPSYMSNAAMVS